MRREPSGAQTSAVPSGCERPSPERSATKAGAWLKQQRVNVLHNSSRVRLRHLKRTPCTGCPRTNRTSCRASVQQYPLKPSLPGTPCAACLVQAMIAASGTDSVAVWSRWWRWTGSKVSLRKFHRRGPRRCPAEQKGVNTVRRYHGVHTYSGKFLMFSAA